MQRRRASSAALQFVHGAANGGVIPNLPLVTIVAKVSGEPTSTDAARRTDGHKLRNLAVRSKPTIRGWRISAVANVFRNQPLAMLLFKKGAG